MNKMTKNNKIDFVVTWVDGNDSQWIKKRSAYSSDKSKDALKTNRFRDWGLLKYWFRAIEKYTPWVNKIYLITDGQKPAWLNDMNEKLVVVDHQDYMDKKYLPVFNSNAIECTINKIEGLADKFVLFNDDFFIIKRMSPTDFFKHDKPVDQLVEDNIVAIRGDDIFPHILLNNIIAIDEYNKKKKLFFKHPTKVFNYRYGKYLLKTILSPSLERFSSIRNSHSPQPFLKSSFEIVQEKMPTVFEQTLKNRFRDKTDISQYLVRYYQLLTGNFVPRGNSYSQYYNITDDNISKIVKHIKKGKTKTICINDTTTNLDFTRCKRELISAFETILPEKSTYEK